MAGLDAEPMLVRAWINGGLHPQAVGNQIRSVSRSAIADPAAAATRIAGNGRTLMPGLIDAHTHIMFATVPQIALPPAERTAGGGVASSFDPLDVTQYSVPELRAAVEAAENWGTYVTVHAYTPRAVRQAIEAGVKCIDHGQLLDEDTAKLMADKGVRWSLQPFSDDGRSPFAPGTPNRIKQEQMWQGTDAAYALAKKYKIKTSWGTDALFSASAASRQGADLVKLTRWTTPAEVLKMATAGNAELLALSGLRNPYPGKLGMVQEGALADLLLVDGDPLAELKLIKDRPSTSSPL